MPGFLLVLTAERRFFIVSSAPWPTNAPTTAPSVLEIWPRSRYIPIYPSRSSGEISWFCSSFHKYLLNFSPLSSSNLPWISSALAFSSSTLVSNGFTPSRISSITTAGERFRTIFCTFWSAAFTRATESWEIPIWLYARIRTALRFASVTGSPAPDRMSSTFRNALRMESPKSARGAVINASYASPACSILAFCAIPSRCRVSTVSVSVRILAMTEAGASAISRAFWTVCANTFVFSSSAGMPFWESNSL